MLFVPIQPILLDSCEQSYLRVLNKSSVDRTAADEVVSSGGKMERLVVASQGIAASTAQLVVASRVKASRNSTNMSQLSTASKDVTQATGGVVATAKSCMQLVEDSGEWGLGNVWSGQAESLICTRKRPALFCYGENWPCDWPRLGKFAARLTGANIGCIMCS